MDLLICVLYCIIVFFFKYVVNDNDFVKYCNFVIIFLYIYKIRIIILFI